jgi:hypothetical protein
MKDINTFSYDGITLHLFMDYSDMKYSIVVFTKRGLMQYVHSGLESIYEAGKLFEIYKLDILRHGLHGIK